MNILFVLRSKWALSDVLEQLFSTGAVVPPGGLLRLKGRCPSQCMKEAVIHASLAVLCI